MNSDIGYMDPVAILGVKQGRQPPCRNVCLQETLGCMVLTGSVLSRLISFMHQNFFHVTLTLPPVKQEPYTGHQAYHQDQAILKIYIKAMPNF